MTDINYKYAEGQIIEDFKKYVDSTYSEHYLADENIQCLDAWIALGNSSTSFRDTAIKYLWRYGKKAGNNKKDLLKALHYVLLMMYVEHYKDQPKVYKYEKSPSLQDGFKALPYPDSFGPAIPTPVTTPPIPVPYEQYYGNNSIVAVPGIAAPYVAPIGVPFGFPYNTAAAPGTGIAPAVDRATFYQHSDGFGVA